MIAALILKQAKTIFGKSLKLVQKKKKRKKNLLLKKWNKIQL